MNKSKAIKNLENMKRLGVLRSDEEYNRFIKEIEEIETNVKVNEMIGGK